MPGLGLLMMFVWGLGIGFYIGVLFMAWEVDSNQDDAPASRRS